MSYCRLGEESDIYLYGTGKELILHYNNSAEVFPANQKGRENCLAFLLNLQEEGYRVLPRAIERLEAEINGVPFKTDIQLALEELKEERL